MRCASGPAPAPRRRPPDGSRAPRAGSGRAAIRSPGPPHDQIARPIDLGPTPGTENDRGLPLLDDRGAIEDRARTEQITIVDRDRHEVLVLRQVDLPFPLLGLAWFGLSVLPAIETDFGQWRRNSEAPGDRLEGYVRALPAVQPPVFFPVERSQPVRVVGVQDSIRKLDGHLVPLAGISHFAQTSDPDVFVGDARGAQKVPALLFHLMQRQVHP